ncbi:hypothetical protein HY495_02790 [Candidatus Woesearchaeota archaeon]|nr:hypothetical protein [Candidatus Woesearchaeota archaeon]
MARLKLGKSIDTQLRENGFLSPPRVFDIIEEVCTFIKEEEDREDMLRGVVRPERKKFYPLQLREWYFAPTSIVEREGDGYVVYYRTKDQR